MLDEKQRELLAQMRADNLAAPAPFRTLGHWEDVHEKFNVWFNEDGIGDVINQRYNFHFSGEPEQDVTVDGYLDYMTGGEWRDTRKLARTILANKLEMEKYDDPIDDWQSLSWGMLTAIDAVRSMEKYCPEMNTRPIFMVDIGAGWGRIGWALHSMRAWRDYYAIIDLPESLLISMNYLPIMLPDEKHGQYDKYDEIGSGCYYLPAHRILDLPDKSADVIVNVASFQEMTPEYISAYGDIIDKKGKYFYTLQRGHPDRRPWCPSKPHWKLLFSRHPTWSDRYYEAMFEL